MTGKLKDYASMAGWLMADARWAGKTAAERSAELSKLAKAGGGRPRQDRRCFCGSHSMWRACQRNFDCCRKAGVVILVNGAGGTPTRSEGATPTDNAAELLHRTLEIVESAYRCPEWLCHERTERTDETLDLLVAALGPTLRDA